jgi:hypothetical protein
MAQEQNVQNTLANGTVVHLKNKTKGWIWLSIFASPFLILILFMIGGTIKSIVNNMESFMWFVLISSIFTLWAWTLKLAAKYLDMEEEAAA